MTARPVSIPAPRSEDAATIAKELVKNVLCACRADREDLAIGLVTAELERFNLIGQRDIITKHTIDLERLAGRNS